MSEARLRMPEAPPLSRRSLLVALTSVAPLTAFLAGAYAQGVGNDGGFMHASRLITGTDALSPAIGQRILNLLVSRDAGLPARLARLSTAFETPGFSRDSLLAALQPNEIETALDIARPWYLGYVGDPSTIILKDDAVFATYLQAQSFEKIIDEVPRPTYPGRSAAWWSAPPAGTVAPSMPADILNWSFHPGGPSNIVAPGPAWRTYAAATHASVDDARRAKP